MRSIAVVSRKGGSGKTTLAGHLAVAAELAGAGPVAKLLIIDTPPAISDSIETCIELADLVVIPSRPSPHDIRSVVSTVELVGHLGKPLVFVLNAALNRARITTEAITLLSRHGPIAPVLVGQRVDFAASMTDGRTVMELPGTSKSSDEIAELWTYLAARLNGNVGALRMAVPKPKKRAVKATPLFDLAQTV